MVNSVTYYGCFTTNSTKHGFCFNVFFRTTKCYVSFNYLNVLSLLFLNEYLYLKKDTTSKVLTTLKWSVLLLNVRLRVQNLILGICYISIYICSPSVSISILLKFSNSKNYDFRHISGRRLYTKRKQSKTIFYN